MEACSVCGRTAGLAYEGPIYGRDPDGRVCLNCIRDGSASASLSAAGSRAEFTDVGGPECAGMSPTVLDEVACRTPGFYGWQQEHWLYHCGDGAAFLGRVGWPELQILPDAIESLRQEHAALGWTPELIEEYLRELDKDGSPSAYLFRCRHCGTHLAYSDFD